MNGETINFAFAFRYSFGVSFVRCQPSKVQQAGEGKARCAYLSPNGSRKLRSASLQIPSQKGQRGLHHHDRMLLEAGGEEEKEDSVRGEERRALTTTMDVLSGLTLENDTLQ